MQTQKLRLNDLLHLSEDEIANSKIELNMFPRKDSDPYIDVWLRLSEEIKLSGDKNTISYCSWQARRRNFCEGDNVFSFVRLNNSPDEWLFISAGKIISISPDNNTRAKVEILERYKPLFGRLIIQYHKGQAFGRYNFKLSRVYKGDESVKEVLPCLYSGDTFNGYDNVHLAYKKLDDLFVGKIMPTYFEALKKVTGVYCLTDTKTGKLYIGSATGAEGVKQRWGNYLDTKHGGNSKLIKLHDEKGDEYFENHFTFTLLEYFGMSYDPEKIKEREQYWKKCFDTIQHGYNDN